jgi:ABC-2 type transport system permease protein
MRIIDIALKDFSQLVRDWRTAGFLVVMPIAFTLLFGFVFSGAGEEGDPRLPVGFLDLDGGTVLSTHLVELLDASDAVRPVVLEDTDLQKAEEQVAEGDLAAAVIVPAGYSEKVLFLSGEGPAPKPLLIIDTASSGGQTAQNAVQAAFARLLGSVQTAQLTAQTYEAQGGSADRSFVLESLGRAVEAWADPPLTVTASQSGTVSGEEEPSQAAANDYAHSSAGIMVQFAMAGLIGAAEILVLERKTGALRRLLTTPTARLEIILGHYLAMYTMILVQLTVLVLFGQLILGVDYFRVPLGTLLMVLITALWSASLGLLIGTLAKTEEQVIIFSLVVMLLLSGLGGAWMPLEFTNQTFQTVGHLTPTAWAIDGFENLVVRGLGLDSVLMPAAILFAFAVVFFALGVWRFRFE